MNYRVLPQGSDVMVTKYEVTNRGFKRAYMSRSKLSVIREGPAQWSSASGNIVSDILYCRTVVVYEVYKLGHVGLLTVTRGFYMIVS